VEVSWVEAGVVEYRLGRRLLAVPAGSAVIIPEGVDHGTGFVTAVRAASVKLSCSLLEQVAEAFGPDDARQLEPMLAPRSSRIVALGRLLLEELADDEVGQHLAVDALCEALAVEVLRAAPATARRRVRDPRIRAAVERIERDHAEPLTIDELAATAAMSRYHFSRCFREATGQSPYRYLITTRLARAAALLRGGRCSVTEAALSVGFGELGRFSRMFREHTGQSPEQFRRERGARSAYGIARSA
jgi:AraC family transcriptional regulator